MGFAARWCRAPGPLACATLALAAFVLASGCNPRLTLWQAGLGSWTTDLVVDRVVERGSYLDAELSGHGLHLRTFTLDEEVCRRVLEPGAVVDYVERGVGGRFDRDGDECSAAGIGDPLIAGARQPRRGSLRGTPIPRARATFSLLHSDEEVALLRGRFPLASAVGWARADDTVAVIPNTPACSRPMESGIASMEYRGSGRNTLTLVSPDGTCRIEGLILPVEALPKSDD